MGVLLVNLGTPDAPRPAEVRRYLREFLLDPRVIDIHPAGRWPLVQVIALTRAGKSAGAYQKIWGEDGSPLLVNSLALRDGVRAKLETTAVELGMRYGRPSIDTALAALHDHGCDHLVVVPLYPQYAASSTGSSLEKVYAAASERWNTPYVTVVPPFFDHPTFLDSFAELARARLDEFDADHLLLSFHGLPERHMRKSAEGPRCLSNQSCCDELVDENRNCYRAQCFATARGLMERLDGFADRHTICFQSRLGRDPWIKPYTDKILVERAKAGDRRLAVMCPAFVADCLETLEEIAIRARDDFMAAGGEDLVLIPSLNAEPGWVDGVVQLVAEASGPRSS
jgi:ferrochelatase